MTKKLIHVIAMKDDYEVYHSPECDTVSPREYWLGRRDPSLADCVDCKSKFAIQAERAGD